VVTIFWVKTTYILEKVWRFGRIYRLHFLGSRVSLGKNETTFPLRPSILSESLSLFHPIYSGSYQARTGLYKIWFSKSVSLSLPPPVAGFLLGLLFNCEDGGDMFLRKVRLSLKHTASQPRIPYSLYTVFHCNMENSILVLLTNSEFYSCVSLK
jgi:hypothetical protein